MEGGRRKRSEWEMYVCEKRKEKKKPQKIKQPIGKGKSKQQFEEEVIAQEGSGDPV